MAAEVQYKYSVKMAFHALALLHHTIVCLAIGAIDQGSLDKRLTDVSNLRWRYLTTWNFANQIVYLVLALSADVLGWRREIPTKLGKRLRDVGDFIFTALVAPVTIVITLNFWVIYAIDRELMYPKHYEGILSPVLNHCVHTNILMVVLIETLMEQRFKPKSHWKHLVALQCLQTAFAVSMYGTHWQLGVWLYPICEALNSNQRILFAVFLMWLPINFSYFAGWTLSELVSRRSSFNSWIPGLIRQKLERHLN